MMLPNPNDATSMARGAMPLAMLARTQSPFAVDASGALCPGDGLALELVTREAWSWSDLVQCDAVFLQRPSNDGHYKLAVMAKQLGLPLWVDYDDALDCLPQSNPLWSEKFVQETAGYMSACLQFADIVTVTTPVLAERIHKQLADAGKLTENKVRVLPNAHNDYLMPFVDTAMARRVKTVTWRGSATHDEDLLTVLPQLVRVANDPEFKDWKFVFLGEAPWEVRRDMPKERTYFSREGWKNYFSFINDWAGCSPAIHIVPLADSEFNRAKSNLAWIEATAIGAVTLAPEFAPEFHRPGVWRYTDFARSLSVMMINFGNEIGGKPTEWHLANSLNQSRAHIREKLLLSQVNEQRGQILRELMRVPKSKLI